MEASRRRNLANSVPRLRRRGRRSARSCRCPRPRIASVACPRRAAGLWTTYPSLEPFCAAYGCERRALSGLPRSWNPVRVQDAGVVGAGRPVSLQQAAGMLNRAWPTEEQLEAFMEREVRARLRI
jgi:hypothetical protein